MKNIFNLIAIVGLAVGIFLGLTAKDRLLDDNLKNHRYYLTQECVRHGKELVQLKGKALGFLPAPEINCATVIKSLQGEHDG